MSTRSAGLEVRGGATPEEIAAVLVVVAAVEATPALPEPYERWRAQRIRVIRAAIEPA